MAKQDFLPASENDLLPWFENFSSKLGNYQTLLGLQPFEVSQVQTDFLLFSATLMSVNQAKQEAREWVAFKNVEFYGPPGEPTPQVPGYPPPFALSPVAPGIVPRIRALAARIRAHAAYTSQLGADLGLIGAEVTLPAEIKPAATAKGLANFQAEIAFKKRTFDGVDIESQRAAETEWTYLAFDAFSPYVDNRPPLVPGQVEQRRYRVRYREADIPVGEYSDTLSVNVGP